MILLNRQKILFKEALAPLEQRYANSPKKLSALEAFRDRVIADGKPFRASCEHPVVAARYWFRETKIVLMGSSREFRNLTLVSDGAQANQEFSQTDIAKMALHKLFSRGVLVSSFLVGIATILDKSSAGSILLLPLMTEAYSIFVVAVVYAAGRLSLTVQNNTVQGDSHAQT